MADNFYHVNGVCKSKDFLKTLAQKLTVDADTNYKWSLVSPATIDTVVDTMMLSTDVVDDATTYKRYLKIYKTPAVSLNSEEQVLLNKYNYQGAFNSVEITYLQKYFSAQSFPTTPVDEKGFLINWYNLQKDKPLTPDSFSFTTASDIAIANIINYIRLFNNPKTDTGINELFLYAKELAGDSLTTEETNKLKDFKTKRVLSEDEKAKAQTIFTNRGLNENLAKLVILEYLSTEQNPLISDKTSSIGLGSQVDTTVLSDYRSSRILTGDEMTKIVGILGKLNTNNSLMWQIGSEVDTTKTEIVSKKGSLPARLAWYKHVHTNLTDYTGVEYWITLNKESLNLVVRGDASVDVYPYNNWLTGYAYVGTMLPIDTDSIKDKETNWCMTVTSDISPYFTTDVNSEHYGVIGEEYGFRTANGVTDITVMETMAGIPYQPHYPAFYTINPTMDKVNVDGSRWNKKKHQFSEITVVHPFDMERGKFQNVLVGDDSAIFDGDNLIYNKIGVDPEAYLKFKITAPYNFINNSPNVNYCIAIRVKVEDILKGYYENPNFPKPPTT